MSFRVNLTYSVTLVVVTLCVFTLDTSTVLAKDVITAGFDTNLVELPAWDPGKNADTIIDTGSTVEGGNQVIPFGTSFYVGGVGSGVAAAGGLIMKYDTATAKVLPVGGKPWLTNAKRDGLRPMAIDGSGNVFTGAWDRVTGKGNYFTKYSATTYAEEWSRYQGTVCPSPTENSVGWAMMSMVIDGSTLYSGNTACTTQSMRFVATLVSSAMGGTLWRHNYGGTNMAKFSPYGGIAIGPNTAKTKRYLYASGIATGPIYPIQFYSVRWELDPATGAPKTPATPDWVKLETYYPSSGAGNIAVDQNNGNVYLSGYHMGSTKRIYHTKAYDGSGNWMWSAIDTSGDGTSGNNDARDIAIAKDGASIYITGLSSKGFYTLQYNATNGVLIRKAYSTFGLGEQAEGIAVDPSTGNVYITGYVPYDMATTDKINLKQVNINNGSSMSALFQSPTALTVNTKHQNDSSTKPGKLSRPFYVQLCVTTTAYDATNCYAGENPSNVEFATTSVRQAPLAYSTTGRNLAFTIPADVMAGLAKGDHNLHVCVDPYRAVAETNEDKGDNCKTITLTINAPPEITFDGPTDVKINTKATLSWVVTGATSCLSTGDGGFNDITIGAGNYTGSYTTTPLTVDPSNFELRCTNAYGPTTKTLSINIHNPQATIMASPARVRKGGSASIAWQASDVSSCSITKQTQNGPASMMWGKTPPGQSNHSSVPLTGSQEDTITETSTYFMNCVDAISGTEASAKVIVNLVPGFSDY